MTRNSRRMRSPANTVARQNAETGIRGESEVEEGTDGLRCARNRLIGGLLKRCRAAAAQYDVEAIAQRPLGLGEREIEAKRPAVRARLLSGMLLMIGSRGISGSLGKYI